MAVQCKKCGGSHPTWECTASAAKVAAFTKSASADASIPRSRPSGDGVEGAVPTKRRGTGVASSKSGASTQAKSAGSNQQELPRPKEGPAVGGEVTIGLAAKPKLGRGRPLSPNPKSPRAAYQRELMRKLRAKDKADGKRRARLKAEQEQSN